MKEYVRKFVETVVRDTPGLDPVFEFGSFRTPKQDELANLRPLFEGRPYTGCDLREGLGVDRIEDLHHLKLENESVGTVLVMDTLEHVVNPFEALAELKRVLKPGGLLVASVPFYFPIHPSPSDFWRFTPECFRMLLSIVGPNTVT